MVYLWFVTAALPAAPAAVPFWLQVMAVTAAPILGFAGVAVGAMLKERSDMRIAERQELREVYRNFVRTMTEVEMLVSIDGASAYESADEEAVARYVATLKAHLASLNTLCIEILLIGSEVASFLAQAAIKFSVDAIPGEDDHFDAADFARRWRMLTSYFLNVAQYDLRVRTRLPRGMRKRTPDKANKAK
jgi:hypothetical protein